MNSPVSPARRPVPARALAISVAAFLVPVTARIFFPQALAENVPVLWLLAVVPAFLLAYYRGWWGVSVALGLAMVALVASQAIPAALGTEPPDWRVTGALVATFVVFSLAVGVLAARMRRDQELAERMALTDPLTELPNRRHARLFLENEFAAATRGRRLAIVLFDLDRFKSYNDRHGHEAGDNALRHFARILRQNVRRMDLAARYGGEEFLAVLSNADEVGATRFAQRLRSVLTANPAKPGPLTVSAGIAGYRPGIHTTDDLLAAADEALYRAKQEGRDRTRVAGQSEAEPTPAELPSRA